MESIIVTIRHLITDRREYRAWRAPDPAQWDRFLRLSQPEHQCGYLIGSPEDLKKIPLAQREEFYDEGGGNEEGSPGFDEGLPLMLEAHARELDDDAWRELERNSKLPVKRSKKMANGAKKTPKPAKPAEAATGRTRFTADDVKKINVKAEGNPRRKNSKTYDAFNIYKSGMTVGAFKQAGGRLVDLKADIERGHVELTD